MIKKICIIFTFVLIALNISKVEAMTQTNEINILNGQEIKDDNKNSSLRVFVVESATQERLPNVTVKVEEIETGISGEYTTKEDGIAYIDKIGAGAVKITVVAVPDEYKINTMEFIIEIKENRDETYAIGLNHKTGQLLIKSEAGTTLYIYNDKNVLQSQHGIGEEKHIYLSYMNTGKYILKKVSNINGEEVTEISEFIVKENSLCEVDLTKKEIDIVPDEPEEEEEKENENNSTEEKPEEKPDDTEIKEEEDTPIEEDDDKEENNQNEDNKSEEEVENKEPEKEEKPEEIKDNLEGATVEQEKEEIEDSQKDKDESTQENQQKEEKEENKNNMNKNKEQKENNHKDNQIEENDKDKTEEEINIKEDENNEKKENNKLEESKEDKINTEEKHEEDNKIANTEKIKEETTEEQLVLEVEKVSTKKLPRTGEDYFIVKVIIADLILFILFLLILSLILKKRKTDYKNSLLCKKLKNDTN